MRAKLARLDYLLIAIIALLVLALFTVWCKPAWSLDKFSQASPERRVSFPTIPISDLLIDVATAQIRERWQTVVDGNNRICYDLLVMPAYYGTGEFFVYTHWLELQNFELQNGLVGGARLYYGRQPTINGW